MTLILINPLPLLGCTISLKRWLGNHDHVIEISSLADRFIALLGSFRRILITDILWDRKIWQEPCIVFCPHWSLRLGPVTHLLRRWRGDQNSLLVIEVLP